MSDYLKIAELAGSLVGKLLGLKKDRKEEVANYLDEISITLSTFPIRVRNGATFDELVGLSTQAREYAKKFKIATNDVLSEEEISEFVSQLNRAHNAKEALTEESPEEKDQRLRTIAEAAASLKVCATTLRGAASQIPPA